METMKKNCYISLSKFKIDHKGSISSVKRTSLHYLETRNDCFYQNNYISKNSNSSLMLNDMGKKHKFQRHSATSGKYEIYKEHLKRKSLIPVFIVSFHQMVFTKDACQLLCFIDKILISRLNLVRIFVLHSKILVYPYSWVCFFPCNIFKAFKINYLQLKRLKLKSIGMNLYLQPGISDCICQWFLY